MRDLRRIALSIAAGLTVGSGVLVGLASASGSDVTSYSEVSAAPNMVPVAMADGPGASDVLIAGGLPEATPPFTVLPTVLAVNVSTGQLDSGIGSSGQLPMPSGLPTNAAAQYVLVADGGIYASFKALPDVYIVGWNAQGQLLTGFGSGGLVTVAPPAGQSFNGAGSHLASGSQLAFAGGNVVLGEALNGNGGGIGLYPLDPASGAGATSPVVTALPAGSSSVDLDSMQAGPDGRVYLAGSAAGTGALFYYGVFDGTTLQNDSQTTEADGDSASGDGIAFFGSTAYLGITSTSSSVKTTQLWSAPLGSATLSEGPSVPTAVSGEQQQLVGVHAESSGALDAVVDDGSGGANGTTWVVSITGGTAGTGQQVGTAGTNAQTVSGDALRMSGNGYFSDGEHPFVAVYGPPTVGVCDWTVAYSGAPTHTSAFPIGWGARITNQGTGSCPASTLTSSARVTAPLGGGTLPLKPENAPVPGLAPQQTYGTSLVIERANLNKYFRDYVSSQGTASSPEASVHSSLPEDADGCCDEHAYFGLRLGYQLSFTIREESNELAVDCPPDDPHACDFILWLFFSDAGRATQSTAAKAILTGTAHGTVKRGSKGRIPFKLTNAGRKLLRNRHELHLTVVGARTSGKTETLVKAHLALSLRH